MISNERLDGIGRQICASGSLSSTSVFRQWDDREGEQESRRAIALVQLCGFYHDGRRWNRFNPDFAAYDL